MTPGELHDAECPHGIDCDRRPRASDRDELAAVIRLAYATGVNARRYGSLFEDVADAILARWRLVPVEQDTAADRLVRAHCAHDDWTTTRDLGGATYDRTCVGCGVRITLTKELPEAPPYDDCPHDGCHECATRESQPHRRSY